MKAGKDAIILKDIEPKICTNLRVSMKILVIAPHPDDETSVVRHYLNTKNNEIMYWLTVTSALDQKKWGRILSKKENLNWLWSHQSMDLKLYHLKFPSSEIDMVPISNIVSEISRVIEKVKPNLIYIPFIQTFILIIKLYPNHWFNY